jgi:PAS domain S-box-containing protein
MPGDLAPPSARPSAPADPSAPPPGLQRILWDIAETSMALFDPDRRIRELNPLAAAAYAPHGLGVGDVVGDIAELVCSVGGSTVYLPDERPLERALRGEHAPREVLEVHYHGDPQPRLMAVAAHPVTLEDGTLRALLSWSDITDSWRSAEQSRDEINQLGQLLEGASDYAIIMLDPFGQVTTWSGTAERILGYPEDEAIGRSYASFFDEADRAAGLPEQILSSAVARGKVHVEGRRVRRDGSVFWAHGALTAIREDDGGLRGFVKVTHDVSERRAIEDAVVHLNRELKELNEKLEERVAERTIRLERQAADLAAVNAELEAFSYSVSHDLRAPLRAMSGFARIIEQDYGAQLPPEAIRYLGKVTDNARHMGVLIDALLSFSRMQRQTLHSVPIDMTALVRDCWSILEDARGERQIEFLLADLPPADGDRRLVQQVWLNLLDNAIKYTSRTAPARIEVDADPGAGQEGDAVTYRVTDNGAGFDMRYAGKIGQVFQRLHHPAEFPGVGIGLALAQRIVQRHGGRLIATGQPGDGATVGFTLNRPFSSATLSQEKRHGMDAFAAADR